ncbi:MAG: IS110 family transposase [Trueperaceae bacterium]
MIVERTHVGLDVHAHAVVAAAIDSETGELTRRRLTSDPQELVAWLRTLPGPVAAAYEAGPTGFALARALRAAGVRCEVLAPSKLQRPVGERVKTDARDALHLAKLLRLDEFVTVTVPSEAQEAARDLVRAREDARRDLMSAKHRLGKLLLRKGIVYPGKTAWTSAYTGWLRRQRFELPGLQAAFDAGFDAVMAVLERRERLDEAILAMAADSEFTGVTRRLGCLRGISTLSGFALAVEIGDWTRLDGRRIGSYLGLVPSENSSGQSRSQGALTRTGNAHARRLLIEAAWHHRSQYSPSAPALRARWELASREAKERGHEGNRRLHRRWKAFQARGKRNVIANAAIARELAGWCWSLAVMDA